jgi:arylsulfatase A-like enzyme
MQLKTCSFAAEDQTTDHLPVNRGFATHFGYLEAAEHYYHGMQEGCDIPQYANLPIGKQHTASNPGPRHGQWPPPNGGAPRAWQCHFDMFIDNSTATSAELGALEYDTNAYAQRTVDIIASSPASRRLYVHLMWHAVHSPYTPAPLWEGVKPTDSTYKNYCPPPGTSQTPKQHERCNFGGILKTVDAGMKNVTDALRAAGRWNNTLLWVSSDNGGVGPGNNHPLRGQKSTPWQGGTKVAAFLAGGWLPTHLRGTQNDALMHVADVYPTLCGIVGVDPTDTVMLPAYSPSAQPRPIDGVDIWSVLLAGGSRSPRQFLPTTEHSIIWQAGDRALWKLINGAGRNGWYPAALGFNMSGKIEADEKEWPCTAKENSSKFGGKCAVCSEAKPCLFDLLRDEGERDNLAETQSAVVTKLAKQLATYVSYAAPGMSAAELDGYDCLSTKVTDACPCLTTNLTPCSSTCLTQAWWGNFSGPCCRPKPKPNAITTTIKTDDPATALLIEAHCSNAIRIRVAPPGAVVKKTQVGALKEGHCGAESPMMRLAGPGKISNGNIKAVVSSSHIIVSRISDGTQLLSGSLPSFAAAECGDNFHIINASFASGGGGSWYGLGQLGSHSASGSVCNPTRHPCTAHVPALNRETLGPVSMTSVKYWIGIPWMYNRHNWGVFFNQPGDGVVDVSHICPSLAFCAFGSVNCVTAYPPLILHYCWGR